MKEWEVSKAGFLPDGRHYTILQGGHLFVEPFLKEKGRPPTPQESGDAPRVDRQGLVRRFRYRRRIVQGIKIE